ncbi:MAG: hypothetical protein U0X39_03135 [Bacteroidales bacterium]
MPNNRRVARVWGSDQLILVPNLQLFISTGEKQYSDKFLELLWPKLERNVSANLMTALQAIPGMEPAFKEKLRPYVLKYKKEYIDKLEKDNPYGV